MKKISESEMDELLTRGVGEFIDPDNSFRKKLETDPASIVIKFGMDPTRPDIHIGHAIVLRKLRKFQDMGCKVVFLVGDLTAQIGDPTGKSKIRPEISQIEVDANMKTYLDQVGLILKTDPAVFSWTRNSDWFVSINDVLAPGGRQELIFGDVHIQASTPLPQDNILNKASYWLETRMQKTNVRNFSFINLMAILRKITYARLIERDMFQDRIKDSGELYMHEMLYPVIQGIDSRLLAEVYGSCDLEVGGTDQTFNMLMGRDVMKISEQKPQAVLSFELLEGLDGKEKMSKSLDNYIAITDAPDNMYGKVMSVPDSLIVKYFKLATYSPLEDIETIEKELQKSSVNPRDIKMRLAREIVAIYHGDAAATKAEQSFVDTFSGGKIPDGVEEVAAQSGEALVDVFLRTGVVSSRTDFRRLVEAGAITNLDTDDTVGMQDAAATSGTYRVGKKRFLKIS